MAFRGRGGRGRGFGGGGFRFAKQEAFELFPPINLPAKTLVQEGQVRIEEDIDEALRYNREFRRHFKNSPYYLQETADNTIEETREIETYSNRAKRSGRFGQESLSKCGILLLEPGYFPAELLQGTKRQLAKKVRWNPKRDLQKLDFLEQLEEKLKKGSTEQEDEEENEDEDNEEELDEDEDEDDDLGDYGKASDVDDDEDDYNDKEDGDDEPLL